MFPVELGVYIGTSRSMRGLTMIKACVFDVGNTLINDSKLVSDTLCDLASWLKKKGVLREEDAFISAYKEFNRIIHHDHWSHTYGEVEWFRRTVNALRIEGISPEEVLIRYRQLIEEKTKPDPDVIKTFRFLRRRGIKVALLSNERSARMKMFLKRTKVKSLLDAIVVSEEEGVEKPHPLMFEKVSRELGIKFSEMIMFGDSEVTDGGGKKLGLRFVLVKAYKDPSWDWGEGSAAEPDYVVEKITRKEIERCLKAFEEKGD